MVDKKKVKKSKVIKQKQGQTQKQVVNINLSEKKTKKRQNKKVVKGVPTQHTLKSMYNSIPMMATAMPMNNNELLNEIRNISLQHQNMTRIPIQTTNDAITNYKQGVNTINTEIKKEPPKPLEPPKTRRPLDEKLKNINQDKGIKIAEKYASSLTQSEIDLLRNPYSYNRQGFINKKNSRTKQLIKTLRQIYQNK